MATVGTPGAIQQPPSTAGIFGQGVKYPLTLTTQGRLALSSGETSVREALQTILETAVGERAMLPTYGARQGEFEPIDLARMVAKFKKDVAEHEPRVEAVSVDSIPGPGAGEVSLTILYVLVGEATENTLTYPLFVGP